MPVPLFEHQPSYCPFGHELGPGRVQVSFTPCLCQPAKDAAARGRGMGHLLVRCHVCEDEGRETVFYEPPHDARQQHLR